MQTKLDREAVLKLGHLARIRLTEEEAERFGEQLSSIIDYNMTLLNEVDITDVESTLHTGGLTNKWRSDAAQDSLPQDVALMNAPKAQDGQVVVRKVLGSES
jgi:aspartyl-tRNA(Asn)/glutamyl-tRNA(Gln) amidotransferase subunit C